MIFALCVALIVVASAQTFDDATKANCADVMEYGFKYSYTKERCYCPKSRMKMTYEGVWLCRLAATGKTKELTNEWDTAPSSISTRHCYGDRKGYVYVPSTGKCECKQENKRYIKGDVNSQVWACRFSASDFRLLMAHERTKAISKISQKDCVSSRLIYNKKSMQCQCRKEHFVYGGADTTITGNLYCDLGGKRERTTIHNALRSLSGVAQYSVLKAVSEPDVGRFVHISNYGSNGYSGFRTDTFTEAARRRKRNSKYFDADETKAVNWVNGETKRTAADLALKGYWMGKKCAAGVNLARYTNVCSTLNAPGTNNGVIRCEGYLPPGNYNSACCIRRNGEIGGNGEAAKIFCSGSAVRKDSRGSYYLYLSSDLDQSQDDSVY